MGSVSAPSLLGGHSEVVRDVVVEALVDVHRRFAEAQDAAQTRHKLVYGALWRDLLDTMVDRLSASGFSTTTLAPGRQRVPVVNGCIVYAWRCPSSEVSPADFAKSATRRKLFSCEPADPQLPFDVPTQGTSEFDDSFRDAVEVLLATPMPVVMVIMTSTPRGLLSIEWGRAELDDAGNTWLREPEVIWTAEAAAEAPSTATEAFDSGVPRSLKIEPRQPERAGGDA